MNDKCSFFEFDNVIGSSPPSSSSLSLSIEHISNIVVVDLFGVFVIQNQYSAISLRSTLTHTPNILHLHRYTLTRTHTHDTLIHIVYRMPKVSRHCIQMQFSFWERFAAHTNCSFISFGTSKWGIRYETACRLDIFPQTKYSMYVYGSSSFVGFWYVHINTTQMTNGRTHETNETSYEFT